MKGTGKDKGLISNNLIRLHPNEGGREARYGDQRFLGVSPDIFIALDLFNQGAPYIITRKFNINIQINPRKWSSQDFFCFFTQSDNALKLNPFSTGALEKTDKCTIHGDYETGLRATPNLMAFLCQEDLKRLDMDTCSFKVNNNNYFFHSIGVAANENYASVGDRNTSHFEIKFQRQDANGLRLNEFLCLNIHLTANDNKAFNKKAVKERLNKGIRLFYAELGVLNGAVSSQTRLLKDAMIINLDNFIEHKFSCKNQESLDVLEAYNLEKARTVSNPFSEETTRVRFFKESPSPAVSKELTLQKSYSNTAVDAAAAAASSKPINYKSEKDSPPEINEKNYPPLRP